MLEILGNALRSVLNKLLWALATFIGTPVGALIRFFGPVLHPTRSALILIVACGAALAFTDQGKEIARSLTLNPWMGNAGFGAWLADIVVPIAAMTWWAVQSWWWSRILLNRRISGGNVHSLSQKHKRVIWTPRIYALAVFAIAAIPLAFDHRWADVIVIAGIGVIVLLILIFRTKSRVLKRAFVALEERKEPLESQPPEERLLPTGKTAESQVRKEKRPLPKDESDAFANFTRRGLVMVTLSFAVPLVMFLLLSVCRTQVAFFLGTLAVTFVAMASILPVLATLTISEAASRAPVLISLAVWAALVAGALTLLRWDNHEVRVFADRKDWPTVTAGDALNSWTAKNGPNDPLILVYSAGGGLRAAYWTAALLGTLEDETPRFHCRLFAISGVSGGSVGAVFWAGALQSQLPQDGDACAPREVKLRPVVQRSLAKDYLAPGLTGLLFGDLPRAFLPLPGDDRAVALEQAWEVGFQREIGSNALAQGFHNLWPDSNSGPWMPILLLNGTQQETGQRIITSNIQISDRVFPKAHDFFDEFGREIRASTAALNSARFTYVSPAGRITSADGKTDYGHILDGGYFENYGARTIGDLYAALPLDDHRKVILIEMINDTELADDDASRCETKAKAPDVLWSGTVNELVAPIGGMLAARQARGMVDARATAKGIVPTYCGDGVASAAASSGEAASPAPGQQGSAAAPTRFFFQLRICPGLNPSPPLGWVMGERSVENIRKLIDREIPDDAIGTDGTKNLGTCARQLRERLKDLKVALSQQT